MKFYIKIVCFFLLTFQVNAQQTPAPPQSGSIGILGATAHLGNGKVIENSFIAFENGKITSVADATTARINQSNFDKIIQANGKHVYPGFIAPNSQLGLVEIGAVRATRDYRELGRLNPNLRSIIAYNTDSDVIPTIRANGILMAQITTSGVLISGQSSIVEFDGWNWEDAAYKMDEGVHMNYPRAFRWSWRTRALSKNKDYDQQVKEIKTYFQEAHAYAQNKNLTSKNLKFEAMRGLFDGSKKLYLHESNPKAIMEAVTFLKEVDITPIVVGGSGAWMITDFLKKNNVAVILSRTQALPSTDDSDIDQPFKTPRQLEEAGVLWCLQMDDSPYTTRNLPFQAGHAVGFGLDKEAAVRALTLNTAKILGIDATVGSLEVGKDATLFISSGDALDMRGNNVEQAFIRGKELDMDDKQKRLYRKFQEKYKSQK